MDINKIFIKQIAWRAVAIASTVSVNVMFARVLHAPLMGEVLYLFAIYSFLIQLIGLSMESGVAYFAATNAISSSRLLGFSVTWSILATALMLVFIVALGSLLNVGNYPLTFPAVFILGNLLLSFGTAYCYSRLQFSLPAAVTAATCVLMIILLIADENSTAFSLNVPFLYFVLFFIQGAVLIAWVIATTKAGKSRFILSFTDIKKIARYSILACIANLLFLLVTRIDYLFIKTFHNNFDLGNYAQASRIAQLLFLLPGIIATVVFPLTATSGGSDYPRKAGGIVYALLGLNALAGITVAVCGPWLFPAVFGDTFSKMHKPFMLLLPGILAMSAAYPFAAFFAAKNKIRINIVAGLLSLLIIVPGDFLFIPRYGINAAAIVSSAGYIVYAAYIIGCFILKRKQNATFLGDD